MTKWWAAPLLIAALAACSAKPEPAQVGQATFEGFGCVKCHRVGHEGGVYGPDLTTIGFRKSPEWLDQWLKDPHAWRKETVMPNYHLPDDIRAPLVTYLSGLKGQDWGATKPWDAPEYAKDAVLRGEKIFNKAGCVACHGQTGKGGYPNNNVAGGQIPSLTLVADGYSKPELKARIKEGITSIPADPSQPAPLIRMPPWHEVLDDKEVDALVEYLYSLRPAGSAADSW